MINRILISTLALLLIALPSLGEAEVETDVEDVPTPLVLAELLPPGGVEAVDVDFWIRIEASYKDRHIDVRFMRWNIQPVEGQLVFTVQTGTAKSKLYNSAKTTYTKEGELVGYEKVSYLGGKKTGAIAGSVEDGQLILKTTSYGAEGQATTGTDTKSLEAFETTVPSEWFSLIAAYHFRKGSLSYSFARTDTAYHFQHADTDLEDVGTEEVQWEGKAYSARMLIGDRTFGKGKKDNPDSKLQYLVLPNGELMYTRNLYHGYKFLGYRVSKEAIEKEFWLPPPPPEAPKAPAMKPEAVEPDTE
jgi:hypothetical protein